MYIFAEAISALGALIVVFSKTRHGNAGLGFALLGLGAALALVTYTGALGGAHA